MTRRRGDRRVAAWGGGLRLALPVAAIAWLVAGCFGEPGVPVRGTLALQPVATTVDTPLAAYYLESNPGGRAPDAVRDARIARVEAAYAGRPPDWRTLRAVSGETSPDFATIYFVRRLLADPRHAGWQARFARGLGRYRAAGTAGARRGLLPAAYRAYRLLFVPGWLYESDTSTGADFAGQRRFLRGLGFDVKLVRTLDNGTVEENAALVAEAVRRESRGHRRLILVSTSKGGPETAMALGELLRPEESAAVRAWISIGGILRGSPFADRMLEWPRSWLAGVLFFFQGLETDSVASMTAARNRARFERFRFPPHLLMVQYIGVPFSGDITDNAEDGYAALRGLGPNDGLTLLADELVPGGVAVLEPGLDHRYVDAEINLKALVLAHLVIAELAGR